MTGLFSDQPFLDEEEAKVAYGFDLAAFEMQTKKILYLREAARKKGITAERLEDLKSESGRRFVGEKSRGGEYSPDRRPAHPTACRDGCPPR